MTASSDEIGLVWFRRDLRLDDNPAWAAATSERTRSSCPLFVIDPRLLDRAGPFRRRQLLATLQALDYALAELGGRLLVRIGDPGQRRARDGRRARRRHRLLERRRHARSPSPATTRSTERRSRSPVETSWGSLVHPPGSVLTAKGTLSRVVHPVLQGVEGPAVGPVARAGRRPPCSTTRASPCRPSTARRRCSRARPRPRSRLEQFLERVDRYDDDRDRPDLDGTSHAVGRPAVRHAVAPHGRRRGRRGDRGPRRRSSASWPGATGTPTCSPSCPALPDALDAGALRPDRVAQRPGRDRGLEGRLHRLPDRRRRHAPAPRDGLDAQPGAHDRRLVPGEGPAGRLAASASATSATCSSTATWPRTSATGSGWPAPGPTPRRTTASSTR